MAAIGMNTICLAIVHYNQPEVMSTVLVYLEYLFTSVFVIEACVKIFGLTCGTYFGDAANVCLSSFTSLALTPDLFYPATSPYLTLSLFESHSLSLYCFRSSPFSISSLPVCCSQSLLSRSSFS